MTTRIRDADEFCWLNMLTSRPADARDFYAAVLGWTCIEMPGMGHRIQAGGRDIGAIFDLDGPDTPPGASAELGVMGKVTDADATVARVLSLGGSARPAWDIGLAGRMSVCGDPMGANFDLWQPKQMMGFDADVSTSGAPSWFELRTVDAPRAGAFYGGVFGWDVRETPGEGTPYATFLRDGAPVAGMRVIGAEGGAPHWLTYFAVPDADRAVQVALDGGATVVMTVIDMPGVGQIAGLVSPQGIEFNVFAAAG